MSDRTPRFDIPLDGELGSEPVYLWASQRLEIVAFRQAGEVRAFSSICPHMGAQLCVDREERRLHCPWHGLSFDLTTGEAAHPRFRRIREWNAEVDGRRLKLYSDDAE